MSGSTELSGPDFVAGVAVNQVPDGGSLLGHARGEAVLLVRKGERLFAVGASCTHYHGPLAEGLVVGDTVRCPWHHACFDLATGAPSGPAFWPLPCYRVERRGGTVTVGEKLTPPTPTPVKEPGQVVIVGAGAAGAMAAEALRRFGHTGSITVLGAEGTAPMDRPNLSKDYLAGTLPEDWLEVRGAGFFSEQHIDFRPNARVLSIDPKGRIVAIEGGESLSWDVLVLATGADPVRLTLPGAEQMLTLRTLADSRAIIARAQAGKRAVIVGASFIGLEVAASLRKRDVEVRVVGLEKLPLERVLGSELGTLIQGIHEEHGVRFHLGRSPKSVEQGRVTLDDGSTIGADFVVAGVGVRPRIDLAEKAGLKIDRGIVVDAQFRAAPGIYAVGDVARWPDPRSGQSVRIEHWMVAQRHGEAVARTILGRGAPFRTIPFFWSAHYDVTVNYVGHAPSFDRVKIDGNVTARDAAVHYFLKEKLLAVATLGRDKYALEMERKFEAE